MRWVDSCELGMAIAEKRVGESVSDCYASPVSSDRLTARKRSWLIRCVQIYEGRLETDCCLLTKILQMSACSGSGHPVTSEQERVLLQTSRD
jgi:hypothetical protein